MLRAGSISSTHFCYWLLRISHWVLVLFVACNSQFSPTAHALFSPSQFLCILLLEETFVFQGQALKQVVQVPGFRSQPVSASSPFLVDTTVVISCFIFIFFSFIFISWRLITLQYCSGFCPCFIFKLYTQLTHNRKIIQLGSTHSYEHIKRTVFSSWLQIGSQILEAWGKFEPPAANVMWQSLWDWPKAYYCKQNVGAESIYQLTACKRKKPSVLQPQGTELCQLTEWAIFKLFSRISSEEFSSVEAT